jgi:outer membrane translocation and assembly module TamA
LIGVELKGEYMDARTAVATTSEAERRAFPTASLVFRSNTLDRSAFPTSGHLLALRSELAGGNPSFARYIAHGQVAFPLSRHVSLIGRGVVGAASHDDVLPPHYRFTLGGAFPSALLPETQIDFIGLRSQQQTGAAVTVVGAALQWEARRDVFVTLRSDLGRTGARLTFDRDDYVGGVGASFGVVTPVGPLEVSAGKLLNSARPRIEVSLGRAF